MPFPSLFYFRELLCFPRLSYREEEFIEGKKRRKGEGEATAACGQASDEKAVGGVGGYQSQSRLATEILVFQIKQPNLDK